MFLSSRSRLILFFLAVGWWLSGPTVAAAASAKKESAILHDLVYGHAGGKDLKLDLYLPDEAGGTRPRPIIIFLHGGGWKIGGKAEIEPYVPLITTAGYAVASVDYRLSDDARFPAQIFDCKTAVRWVRANAARYGLNPARIGVLGFSAGGHLAALLGTSEGVKTLEDRSEGSAEASSRVQAVCTVSGPVDLTIPTHSLIGKVSIKGLLGGTAQQKPDLACSGNPALYATHDDAPTLLIYGDQDTLVLPVNAKILSEALRKVGVEASVITVKGGKHVPFFEPQQQTALEFFGRHLNKN